MSMTGNGGEPQTPPADAPQLGGLSQYVKDFSFENPNAPRSLMPQDTPPSINVQINVNATQLAESDYEVLLKLEGKAEMASTVLFAFDLTYAGVFRALNIAQESLYPILLIECPRLLFPFARQIIATAVRDGGFPPLMLEPVDFAALYQQRVAQMQAAATPTVT